MKKYLMTGIAAIALCAAMTSCSKGGDDIYDPNVRVVDNANQAVEKYNQAFLKYVGANSVADIPSNQTWGFGGYDAAGTRGVFANGNEWAANDRDDCKYRVPPVLTPEQTAVVIKYFQTVQNPRYQDPEWTNYFIQQVYKGGESPREGLSPEKYTAADGNTKIVGSNNMDHLAAINGDFVDHNNNFNHGDCGEYGNVLDFKGTLTTVEETYPVNDATHRHPDKINLMTNSTTASFGYYNSNSSVRRTEYTGLVNFQTIIDELGAEANCLNDGWNRSFMGFDFEMMVGDEIYAKGVSRPDENGNWQWYADEYAMYEFNGQQYHMLSSDQNMYCGDFYKNPDGTDINDAQLTDEFISGLLANGYLPVSGGANKKWVKVGGTADGYYSDWIVTLTEAKKYDEIVPDPDDVCIIAEDLSAADDTDFDFNDVVFTVHYTSATSATVTIYAAGGTLPLKVDGKEVHGLLGYGTPDPETGKYKMINTGAKADVNDVPTYSFTVNGIQKSKRGNDIKILVDKGSKNDEGRYVEDWKELTATGGEPAAKLCVGTDFATEKKWCAERESIKRKYPLFSQWVLNNPTRIWWR